MRMSDFMFEYCSCEKVGIRLDRSHITEYKLTICKLALKRPRLGLTSAVVCVGIVQYVLLFHNIISIEFIEFGIIQHNSITYDIICQAPIHICNIFQLIFMLKLLTIS